MELNGKTIAITGAAQGPTPLASKRECEAGTIPWILPRKPMWKPVSRRWRMISARWTG